MKKTIYLFIVLLLAFAGCKKLDLAPTNNYTDLTYWTSTDKANMVLNTAYMQMINSGWFFFNEGLSDNAYSRSDVEGVTSIASNVFDPSLGRLKNEWGFHYPGIKTCNVLIGNIDRVPGMNDELKKRMITEARFLRAFQFFQLTTWFGDVPYFTTEVSVADSKTIGRTSHKDVITNVLKELDEVETILPVNTQYTGKDVGRISKGAVIALKARIQLYESNWPAVITECEKLINNTQNGTYGLFPSYDGLFLPANKNSIETILSRNYASPDVTHKEFVDLVPLSVPGSRVNAMAPTQELVDDYIMLNGDSIKAATSGYDENNAYTGRDPRLTATVVYDGYQWTDANGTRTIKIKPGSNTLDEYKPGTTTTPTGYYIRKYFDPTVGTSFASGNDLMLIRYADVLLMYAEAKNELSQMDDATWTKTIKALRTRAGFTNAAALNFNASWNQSALRSIIRRERRSELAMEGLRIFDILRWRTAETVLNGYAHGAKFSGDPSTDNGYIRAGKRSFDPSKNYLWPVPRDERSLNPNLSQNPGWN